MSYFIPALKHVLAESKGKKENAYSFTKSLEASNFIFFPFFKEKIHLLPGEWKKGNIKNMMYGSSERDESLKESTRKST